MKRRKREERSKESGGVFEGGPYKITPKLSTLQCVKILTNAKLC